jgi:hypothetical protein
MVEETNKNQSELNDGNYWSTAKVNELLRKADEEGLDFKSVDNPFHDNNPELRRSNVLFEYTQEEIIFCKILSGHDRYRSCLYYSERISRIGIKRISGQ